MRNNVIYGSVCFALVFCLIFQTGCFKSGDKTPENLNNLSSIAGPVSFKIMLPPDTKANLAAVASSEAKIDMASSSTLIRAAGEATEPEVTFKLNLVNIGNTAMPLSPVIKKVPVVNGSATVTFTGIPACPCIGEVNIVGGSIDSFTEFHGALDLKRGEQNTLEVAPKGSKMKQDFVAYVLKQVVATPELFGKAVNGVVEMIVQSISNLNTVNESAYEDAVKSFAGFVNVEITIPSNAQEVPNVIGKTQSVAETELSGKGFTTLISTAYNDTIPDGTVISQNPSAWAKVDSGAQINLVVSLGVQTTEYLTVTPLAGGYCWEGQNIKLTLNPSKNSEKILRVVLFDGYSNYTDVAAPFEFSIPSFSGQRTFSATVTYNSGSTNTFTKTVTCKSIIEKVNVQLSDGTMGILYPNSSIPSVNLVPPDVATFVITLASEIDFKPSNFSLTVPSWLNGRPLIISKENENLKLSHSGNILTVSIKSTDFFKRLLPDSIYTVQFNSGSVTIDGTTIPLSSAPEYKFKTANKPYIIFDSDTGTIKTYVGYSNPILSIPDTINGVTVRGIGDWAFNNQSLTSVTLPNTLTSIGNYSFGSNQLSSLSIPSSVVVIGAEAFRYNQLTSISIGSGVTIGDRLLTSNQYFRDAYLASGAGTYTGTQTGTWVK